MVVMDLPATETKTARRKRERAERRAIADEQLAKAARKAIDRATEKLTARLCSPWWAEHVANSRGPYLPDAECCCKWCRRLRKWPSPCVSARNLSYECHVLALAPRQSPDRWRMVSSSEAAAAGLHVVRRRVGDHEPYAGGMAIMVAGCERCEGLRAKGNRFCVRCWAEVKREWESQAEV